jgi:hypothetical protein
MVLSAVSVSRAQQLKKSTAISAFRRSAMLRRNQERETVTRNAPDQLEACS